jgi:hypothetical protein
MPATFGFVLALGGLGVALGAALLSPKVVIASAAAGATGFLLWLPLSYMTILRGKQAPAAGAGLQERD